MSMPADEPSERLIGAELLSAVSAAMVDLHTDPDTPTAITTLIGLSRYFALRNWT